MNSHCEKYRYAFTSENDKDRHLRLIHGGIQSRDKLTLNDIPHASKTKSTNTCPASSETFASWYQLQKYQSDKSHKLERGRPKK